MRIQVGVWRGGGRPEDPSGNGESEGLANREVYSGAARGALYRVGVRRIGGVSSIAVVVGRDGMGMWSAPRGRKGVGSRAGGGGRVWPS